MARLTHPISVNRLLVGRGAGSHAAAACAEAARARRIVLISVALVLMGLADLVCTLAYVTSVGMVEVNPVARHIINTSSSAGPIVLYKLCSLIFCCGALWLIRRHRVAELCGWLCVLLSLALSLHWVRYNAAIPSMSMEMALIASSDDQSMYRNWAHLVIPRRAPG